MDDKNLKELVNSTTVKCPYKECCSYGDYEQCHNHKYVLCNNFNKWYDTLTRQQQKDILQ